MIRRAGWAGQAAAIALVVGASATAQAQDSCSAEAPPPPAPPVVGAARATAGTSRPPWWFSERPYYDPLVAEPRAAQMSVVFLGYSKEFEYQVERGDRRIWDIGVGKEVAIVGWDSQPTVDGVLPQGGWGVGLWIPISFHVVEDFKDQSSPIINTDYRFGGQLKAQYAVRRTQFLGAKLQVGHESTHLGDEFTLLATENHTDFERINVSYEYVEYGVSYEVQDEARNLRWKFRHGGLAVIGGGGFYSDQLLQPGRRTIATSKRNFEPSVGVEVAPTSGGWRPFASLDLRLRTVYDYAKTSADQPEDRQLTPGAAIGFRNGRLRFNERGSTDVFLRGYYGVNPHGQFRNQRNYWMVGFGIFVRV